MNPLVIYILLLVLILLFLVLYMYHYRTIRKVFHTKIVNPSNKIEPFIVSNTIPEQCAKDPLEVFFTEDGHNIEMCYNFIDTSVKKSYAGTIMYRLRNNSNNKEQKGSYIYIIDFLDNHFDIVLYIEFVLLEGKQTIIDTKYYTVYMYGTQLFLEYKLGKKRNESLAYFTVPADRKNNNRYEINIKQIQSDKKIELTVTDLDKPTESSENYIRTISVNMMEEQICDNSTGNDIFIGCLRDKTKFINAFVGIKSTNFNKELYDRYIYGIPSLTIKSSAIPNKIECKTTTDDPSTSEPTLTSTTIQFFNRPDTYLEIKIDTSSKDFKLRYKNSIHNDELNLSSINQKNIYDFFNIMRMSEEMYEFPTSIYLEKRNNNDSYFFDSYDNRDTFTEDEHISYLFDLKSVENQNSIKKMYFIELKEVFDYIDSYENIYMMFLGIRTSNKSYFQFLNMNKPYCVIMFKQHNTLNYEYKLIRLDINLFYRFQREYILYMKKNMNKMDVNDELNTLFFKEFLNSRNQTYRVSSGEVEPSLRFKIKYNFNLFKMYEEKNALNISANLFINQRIDSTIFVNEFKKVIYVQKCNFVPIGTTIFDCKQLCYDGIENKTNTCKKHECNTLCDNCTNSDCEWNLVDIERLKLLSPSAVNLKGLSGDTFVKLSWIRPVSRYGIDTYYIIKEQPSLNTTFDLMVTDTNAELIEYDVKNLLNNTVYVFYVLAKNKFGISEVSNKISIIPNKNKVLKMDASMSNYSDSIQTYYNDNYDKEINVPEQIQKLMTQSEINSLKNELMKKLSSKQTLDSYNINIY